MICINGEEEVFDPDTTDDDMRFGMLAYGIIPNFAKRRPPAPAEKPAKQEDGDV